MQRQQTKKKEGNGHSTQNIDRQTCSDCCLSHLTNNICSSHLNIEATSSPPPPAFRCRWIDFLRLFALSVCLSLLRQPLSLFLSVSLCVYISLRAHKKSTPNTSTLQNAQYSSSTAAEQRGKEQVLTRAWVMCKRRTLITKISQTNKKLFFFQFFSLLTHYTALLQNDAHCCWSSSSSHSNGKKKVYLLTRAASSCVKDKLCLHTKGPWLPIMKTQPPPPPFAHQP
jgi:hypothetical protein